MVNENEDLTGRDEDSELVLEDLLQNVCIHIENSFNETMAKIVDAKVFPDLTNFFC